MFCFLTVLEVSDVVAREGRVYGSDGIQQRGNLPLQLRVLLVCYFLEHVY